MGAQALTSILQLYSEVVWRYGGGSTVVCRDIMNILGIPHETGYAARDSCLIETRIRLETGR